MQQSQSFNEALAYAQKYAVNHEQNIIDVPTIALGLLQTDSAFSAVFTWDEKDKLTELITKKADEVGTNSLETAAVPLTMNAGLLIKYARQYAEELGDGEIDVYHIMLALLSYPNDVATIFGSRGWIFENYLDEINKLVSPPLETGRLELNLPMSVTQPYPKLRKKFWAEEYKNGIAENLIAEANRHATFGKYASCLQLCDIILDITWENIDTYRLIIYCLCNEKEYKKAIELYNDWAIEDDILRMNIGISHREIGEHEKALEIYKTFEEKTAELHNLTGYSLCALGQYEDAIKEYDEAMAIRPDYAHAYSNKGYALLRMGRLAEAKETILHSLSLDMGNAFAYRNLALVNIEEKDKAGALANIDKALFYRYREKFTDDIDRIKDRAIAL